MSSIAFDAAEVAQPLNDEARAAALWTFVHLKTSHFASQDALHVVRELDLQVGEDPKSLARRLRRALASRGVAIKHSHALDAAARLLGMASWHAGGHQAVHKPLQLRCHFPGFDGPLSTWGEAMKVFGDYCDGDISAGGMCVFQFEFGPNSISMDLPFTQAQDSTGRTMPLMQVLWAPGDRKQFHLAVAAVEGLRRRLEETSRAVIDGLAAVQFCLQTPYPEPAFEDPLNSELVVVDVAPGPSHFEEIARGDEVECWAELEELFERPDYTATGSNWVTSRHQLQWSLSTLRVSGPAPQLLTRKLTSEETGRLLRRYRNAVRAGRKFLPQDRVKRLESLRVETLGVDVDVDWERVSLELARTHLNWQQFLEKLGVGGRPSRLSTTEFSKLVALLDGPGPRDLIRKLKRAELVRLDDDGVLRALVSRVQDVVHEIPRRMDESLIKVVDDAVNVFLTALRMDVETTDGLKFEGFPRSGPYLVYANQGKVLLRELTKHGLVAYAGLMTRVESLKIGDYRTAKSKPLRFDRVLLLDIEYAELVGSKGEEKSFSGPKNGEEETK